MAFGCRSHIACTSCALNRVIEEPCDQPITMGADQLTAAVRAFFQGILNDDLEKIRESLKYVAVDRNIDTEIIESLVNGQENGNASYVGNWNIPNVPKLLPLHLACACGNGDIVKLLILGGADVDSVLEEGETALHFACLYGNVSCARELVARGCDTDLQTRGDTPIMLTTACYGTSGISMKQNYLDIAHILINNGCDINIPDSQGLTPIHLAAGKEDPGMLQVLISAGADVNVRARATVHPSTPLIGAVSAELEENVRLLLAAKCNVYDIKTAKVLLRWNCDFDVSSLESNPLIPLAAIQLATQMGHYSMARLLLYFGCTFKSSWANFTPPANKTREAVVFKYHLQKWFSSPLSLHHLCMLAIREKLGPGLPRKVRKLKIPMRLKKYVITGDL